MAALRKRGYRLWLLSNAQKIFTAYELNHLGLGAQLDGIFLSSDYRCRKPDTRFYRALVEEKGLDISRCMMIGNDRETDIAGAKALGMGTVYMHTGLTPGHQAPAVPDAKAPHYEFEGDDWSRLLSWLLNILES